MKNNHKIILYHFLFWLIYVGLGTLLEYAQNPQGYLFSLPDVFFSQFPNICTVYMCIFVCTKFASPLKPFLLTFGIILVYIFSFIHWYITGYYIRPYIRANGSPTPPFDFLHYGSSVLWVFIRYSILGFGYYFAIEGIKYQKRLRLIEKEKHEAEYAFLRAQINPHFLNNTLNFFYAKSLPLSEKLADGIMTLSEIMRYSLEVDKDDKTALIDDEIAHIRNVITINQLRFNHKLQIDFQIHGETNSVRIIPLILITIVENILKHGDCDNKLNPVKVNLDVSAKDGTINLKTYNRKKKGPKELSSGIGMENIQKRLKHHYGKFALLIIHDTEIDYSIELSLLQSFSADQKANIKVTDLPSSINHSIAINPH
ncbi:sensor histidine kinase [Chryseobacterium sp. G0201]|uniref:sensor histidine kinase n=1 Tax=Chryseobacterium sp. G0201 TaxID=2487065 RepID=UPI000F510B3F|nr:histidine kinase [Chryseobacterium sp. G0201]AZA54535.1 hypothetical protein EG348_16820 [Chryseobacterium sp. G0201]